MTPKQEKAERKRRGEAWADWFKRDPKSAKLGAQAMYDYPDDDGQVHGASLAEVIAVAAYIERHTR